MNLASALLACVILFTAAPSWGQEAKLKVLTSFLPIYLFTRNIVGEAPGVAVDMMLPASLGCPHDYALTPGDMRKIAEADIFIANGFGMETFLGTPVRRANPKITVVESASSLAAIRTKNAGDDHGHLNPHTWVSPRNAVLQVRAIENALAAASPSNAPRFRRNAAAYAARLEALAREYEDAAQRFRNRNIVTFHDVFDYLARDIGLTVVGRIEEIAGQGASAGELRSLIRTIREKKAAAVFAEPQYSDRLAAMVAGEAGVPLRTLDPVSTGSTSPTAYEETMRKNLRTLTEALEVR